MSHSIHRLSIQIDTKSIELVQQHQIVLICKPYEKKFPIIQWFDRCCMIMR